MTSSIKNGGYAFLIRLDLDFFMSLWKEFQLLQLLNDLSISIVNLMLGCILFKKLKKFNESCSLSKVVRMSHILNKI